MGIVHAVGEDTDGGSDNGRSDHFGFGTGGSWWCGEEGTGDFHFVSSKKVLYTVSLSEGVTWLEVLGRTTEPYCNKPDSRLPQIRVRCQIDINRMPSSV